MILLSPLEQFEIISLLPINIFGFDFSVTNLLLINLLTLFIFSNIVYFSSSNEDYLGNSLFFFIPNNWQIFNRRVIRNSFKIVI